MNNAKPTISVIINTTDRAGQLKNLLRALDQQSYPDFEVIVVVGPTQDNTYEILAPYENRIRLLHCPEANLSQSRNIGLIAARGDIVAYIDDDAIPSHHWLTQLAELFQNPNLDATGGAVFFGYPKHMRPDVEMPGVQHRLGIISALLEQIDVRESHLDKIIPVGMSSQWVSRMMGANMAFRREAILDIGGFDEFYIFIAEETDVILRLAQAGRIVQPVKEAYVYHFPASSRNRVIFTYTGRWWLQTRSGTYFALKNAPKAGDSWKTILAQILMLVHGHWLWSAQLRRDGKISWRQAWKIRLEDLYGLFIGMWGGLLKRRQLIAETDKRSALASSEPILRFKQQAAATIMPFNPITGAQPMTYATSSPLRICLLSNTYPPAKFDGVGRLTHLMAQGLFENGHIVHVITHGEKENVSFFDGAYVHEIPFSQDRYSQYRRFSKTYQCLNNSHAIFERVRSLILNEGIQIVDSPLWLCEGLVTEISSIVPVVIRLVTTQRQIAAIQKNYNPDTQLMGDMERLLLEQADHLIPNTQATLNAVRDLYSISPSEKDYTIVPYGVVPVPESKIQPFDPSETGRTLNVLFVGRLEKRKGITDLFAAIPRIVDRIPNVRITIVGKDNSKYDGFAAETGLDYPRYFRQTYADYTDYVHFTGEVSDARLQILYQTCDLFVAPSLYESFGLVYLEAMNYAKPVIGCRTGGVPEVIDPGVTGTLIEPANPTALAEAIVSLLQSPEQLRQMGLNARDHIIHRFSYQTMAQNFADVYRKTIETFNAVSFFDSLEDES